MVKKRFRKICAHCGAKFKGGKLSKYCCGSHRTLANISAKKIDKTKLVKDMLVMCIEGGKAKDMTVKQFVDACLWVWRYR